MMKTWYKLVLLVAFLLSIFGVAQFGGGIFVSNLVVGEQSTHHRVERMGLMLKDQANELRNVRLRLRGKLSNSVEKDGQGRHTETAVNTMAQCSVSEEISRNNATIQISDLVEELDFKSGHGGHDVSMYPDIRADPVEGEELRVFLIPHSHCDPGWLETYTQYYESRVRAILTWLVNFALDTPDFKFIYAEVSFFKLWWDEQDEDIKQAVRKLVRDGQFEFVQGGWVQADEANTHYFALFNQMLDGHDWLKENLPEAIPVSGWAIDPFGLSPMMAYVNKLFGLKGMHIQRVHYTLKGHLAKKRLLDFRWRQSWDKRGVTDIMTHLGPFASYTMMHTCGPDPDICCQYDFPRIENYRGSCPDINPVPITLSNVAEKSLVILDQWRKKASLHSTRNIFVELGDDFRYSMVGEAALMYKNYKMIIDYINNNSKLNTKVTFGTLREYFERIEAEKLPVLSGDFFTYADRHSDYWSGYYTSRAFYKNLDRALESSLRSAEILYSLQISTMIKQDKSFATMKNFMIKSRQTLSLFQHHDGITGTSVRAVVNDYGAMLFQAYETTKKISLLVLQSALKLPNKLHSLSEMKAFNTLEELVTIQMTDCEVVVANTLPRDIVTVVQVKTNSSHATIYGPEDLKVIQQIEPSILYGSIDYNAYHTVFLAQLKSVSVHKYRFEAEAEMVAILENTETRAIVDMYNSGVPRTMHEQFKSKEHGAQFCEEILIGSERVQLALDCNNGLVNSVRFRGRTVTMDQEFLLYTSRKSGAYLFLPDDAGTPRVTTETTPTITVIRGPLRHSAHVKFRDFSISYYINLLKGIEGHYIHMSILSKQRDNGDFTMRFRTDLQSKGDLFTDLNGHTIQHHKYKSKLTLQGNFFPMPSTAFIQDDMTRLTLLSSEAHGVASLKPGYLEVVLDRRNPNNDGRGNSQGVADNLPTPSNFRLLVELLSKYSPSNLPLPVPQLNSKKKAVPYYVEYPSLTTIKIAQTLSSPIIIAVNYEVKKSSIDFAQFMRPLPCDTELVNLRYVDGKTSLMILRRVGFSCKIEDEEICQVKKKVNYESLFPEKLVTVKPHPMSPFQTAPLNNNSTLEPMEFRSFYVDISDNMT